MRVDKGYLLGDELLTLAHHPSLESGFDKWKRFFANGNDIFFLVLMTRMKQAIGDPPVIGEKDKPFRRFVETTQRIKVREARDVLNRFLAFFGGARHDSPWLVIRDVRELASCLFSAFKNLHHIVFAHQSVSKDGFLPV